MTLRLVVVLTFEIKGGSFLRITQRHRVNLMIPSSSRLHFRRFHPADADLLFELDSDPEVMRYLTGGEGTPRQVVEEEMLPRFMQAGDGHPLFGFWALTLAVKGVFVGWVSLRVQPDAPQTAVLGYRLARGHWGQGLASEATRALLEAGFAQTDLNLIVATTYEKNIGSIRVMEKLGMRLIRTFRYTEEDLAAVDTVNLTSGEVWDGVDVEYGINRATWVKLQQN